MAALRAAAPPALPADAPAGGGQLQGDVGAGPLELGDGPFEQLIMEHASPTDDDLPKMMGGSLATRSADAGGSAAVGFDDSDVGVSRRGSMPQQAAAGGKDADAAGPFARESFGALLTNLQIIGAARLALLHEEYGRRAQEQETAHRAEADRLRRETAPFCAQPCGLGDLAGDVAALKKLLFFWKKKNNVLKAVFDDNNCDERELLLAREKLRDYHQLHQLDARWKLDELQKQDSDLRLEVIQMLQELGRMEHARCSVLASSLRGDASLIASRRGDTPPPDQHHHDDDALADAAAHAATARGVAAARCLGAECGLRCAHVSVAPRCSGLLGADGADAPTPYAGRGEAIRGDALASEISVFEPFDCEDLVEEKSALHRQVMDAKEIIHSMQSQLQMERSSIAAERIRRSDSELQGVRERKRRELSQDQRLRERDMEIIRLRNRLEEGGHADDAVAELRSVKLEQEKTALQDQIATLDDEKTRLKHYVGTLGARLEQALAGLEHKTNVLTQGAASPAWAPVASSP
eukprot:gene33464-51716_t